MSSKDHSAETAEDSGGRMDAVRVAADARLVLATLAAASSLAAGVLVALVGSLDVASTLLVTGGLVLSACLHRLGRRGPERA